MNTLDQVISAMEINQADALCGRVDFKTFDANRSMLDRLLNNFLFHACQRIRAAAHKAV